MAENQITDLEPLVGLENLYDLYVNENPIEDLSPLLDNPGIGEGDFVYVGGTGFDCNAHAADLALLEQRVEHFGATCL